MPWLNPNLMNQRIEFARRALRTENFRALCREYGISPRVGYKWRERFMEQGEAGMVERSRRPQRSPEALGEALRPQRLAKRSRGSFNSTQNQTRHGPSVTHALNHECYRCPDCAQSPIDLRTPSGCVFQLETLNPKPKLGFAMPSLPSLPTTPLAGAPPALLRFLESHLAPGETVIWRGRPQSLRAPTVIRIFFGFVYGFFALWIGGILYLAGSAALSAYRTGEYTEVALFLGAGLLMSGIGLLALVFTRRVPRAWAQTVYLLTDRRALIAGPLPTTGAYTALTFTPDQLRGMRRTVTRPDGSGSLVFTNDLEKDDEGREERVERGFLDVAHVETVERLIHQMLHHLDEDAR
jgi:transposase-like protein